MEEFLRVEHVTKQFAGHKALDDVSLTIPRGSVYGLLGPNGAGKTTLIRIINRITAPDSGKVFIGGKELQPEDVGRIGYLPEERGLYKNMKVGEQAIYFARLKGLSRPEAIRRLKEWFVRFGIESWWNKKVEELSKGMAQKMQFIVTVLHEPELLIFDEPFSGFDPVNANLLKEEILKLRDKGSTVIFSTHNMSSVEEICDHITLINRSRNILSGEVGEVRRRYGENIFSLRYRGDEALLRGGLDRVAEVLAATQLEQGLSEMKFRLGEGVTMHDAIHIANEAVEIRSLEEVIPSMNDIFIRAVEGTL